MEGSPLRQVLAFDEIDEKIKRVGSHNMLHIYPTRGIFYLPVIDTDTRDCQSNLFSKQPSEGMEQDSNPCSYYFPNIDCDTRDCRFNVSSEQQSQQLEQD